MFNRTLNSRITFVAVATLIMLLISTDSFARKDGFGLGVIMRMSQGDWYIPGYWHFDIKDSPCIQLDIIPLNGIHIN